MILADKFKHGIFCDRRILFLKINHKYQIFQFIQRNWIKKEIAEAALKLGLAIQLDRKIQETDVVLIPIWC